MSCGCSNNLAAATAALSDASVLPTTAALTPISTNCFDFAARKRAYLEANPTPNPGLRPRRGFRYRKPDPCNEVLDARQQRLYDMLTGVGERPNSVMRTPSAFTADTARQAAALDFANGWIDQLPDTATQGRAAGGIGTLGLGGAGVEKRFGQLCTPSWNILQRPYRFCRTPSVFTCNDGRCQSALDVELGFTSTLDNQANRDLNAPFTKGLGAGFGPGDKTYNQQAIRVTRFGPSSAGL